MISEPQDLNDPDLRDRAVAAARGDAPFDRLIRGATLADMATGELRPADIGLVGPLIASVHPTGQRDDATEIIDATGLIAVPGLIDTHMHVESSMVTPETYAGAVLPRGVTTIVWDPHEFGNVAGLAGVDYALTSAARSALRILPLAPSCVPSAPGYESTGADFGPEVIASLLDRPGIHGLAELMDMRAVTSRAERMRGIVQAGLHSGKLVCGHARSLTGPELQAYVAAGISSDHEITSADDLLEKIRAGLSIELRGSHPYLLPGFAKALQSLPQMPPTVSFCSDDVFPDDLLETGAVDEMLRRMIAHGLDPMRALQAATLNAAIRLDRQDLGLIGPGKRADIVLLDDLVSFHVRHVLRDGAPVEAIGTGSRFPDAFLETCALPAVLAEDFVLRADGATVRLATISRPRFTEWGDVTADIVDGAVIPPDGTTMIAVINRHGGDPAPKLGFLQGWGEWDGAFATTVSHDSHNLTVFGKRPEDMAAAANAVIAARGGMAVARGGKSVAVLPLPVAGLVSDAPLPEVAAALAALRVAMDEVVEWDPPYLTFKALVGATLACNAGPHQTDLGIADSHAGILLASPILSEGSG
ncbi:adenine deaminase C-terminal domain-containing protein [Tropicimonas sp. TH_r6]|uniref:adenine deaminase n=1 Tax=Tropicimonas sp. TH_r6 TaxID=3082085 RepID=UPI0029542BAB|nr:adenine deaminase C-terminal domain-containing protein [Tropicimonas sp. TH_r6]MDV7143469.1 adenine deaminase C-terminal domain-containing protein [Tropicimonas sp. TH_r6]